MIADVVKYLAEFRDQNPDVREYVYFVSDGDNVKIGFTTKPAKRMINLQAANPRQLRVLAVFQGPKTIEGYLHFLFREHHVSGEWFADCEAITKFLSDIEDLIGYRDE